MEFKKLLKKKEIADLNQNINNIIIILDSSNYIIDFNKNAEKEFNIKINKPTKISKILPEIESILSKNKIFLNKQLKIKNNYYVLSSCETFSDKQKFYILSFLKTCDPEHRELVSILDKILENNFLGIYIYNGEKFLLFNKTIEKFTGYSKEELNNMSVWDLIAYRDEKIKLRDAALRRLKGENIIPYTEFHIKKKNGEILTGYFNLSTIEYKKQKAILGIVIDVTEKKKLDDAIKKSQKLEMMGRMAGHIYHDFNNYLAGITGFLSLIKENIDKYSDEYNYVLTAEKTVEKAAKLTQDLTSLTKDQELENDIIDINKIIDTSINLLKTSLLEKKIKLEKKFNKDIILISGDFIKLEEVFINLINNAIDSMNENQTLQIETSVIFLDKNSSFLYNLEEGNYAYITITDEGCGIKKEHLDKIFEPFFTTKKNGIGLGLSIVNGIISAHKGYISVYSEENIGTTFKIYLPIDNKIIDSPPRIENEEIKKGSGKILIVDDDDIVRDMLHSVLIKLGYETITARNGTDALEIYKKEEDIDLVILDLIMPEMDGSATFYELKKINPDIKVLLSSGYSINGAARKLLKDGVQGFLQKPYKISQLSQKILEIIEIK